MKEWNARWRKENKERIKASNANYKLKNKKRLYSDTKKWKENNKVKCKITINKWREKNREKLRALDKEYYKNHKEQENNRSKLRRRRLRDELHGEYIRNYIAGKNHVYASFVTKKMIEETRIRIQIHRNLKQINQLIKDLT
jgi:hypothetical protein